MWWFPWFSWLIEILEFENGFVFKISSRVFHGSRVFQCKIGSGPNTVSESTVSDTELSECFGAHCVPGSELSELLSAYYLCAKANSPSFSQNSPSLPENSVRLSEFSSLKQYSRNSIPPVPTKNEPPPS